MSPLMLQHLNTIFNYANEKGDFVRLRLLMPGWIKGGTLKVPFTKLKTNIP